MKTALMGFLFLVGVQNALALDITATMRHSASARLDDNSRVDVHTASNDEISVNITGIGEKTAIFNGAYELTLIKKDSNALYYMQPAVEGITLWVYFPKTHSITYCKLRAFPVVGTPDSYLMIAKCD